MPKVKSRKVTRKRFTLTKTGKVMHRVQGARHLRRNKSKSRQRRQDKPSELTNTRFKNTIREFIEV